MSPRPELKLHDPDAPRLRVRCEPPPKTKPKPYFALYVVRFVAGTGDVWDAEQLARFGGTDAEQALDYAQNLASDPDTLATRHTVKNADAIVVNDHRGKEWGRFPILRVVRAEKKRRVGWFWRMLGWR